MGISLIPNICSNTSSRRTRSNTTAIDTPDGLAVQTIASRVTLLNPLNTGFPDTLKLIKCIKIIKMTWLVIKHFLRSIQFSTFWLDFRPFSTALKVSKYGAFSGPYFPVFGLNTEIYSVNVRIRKNTDQKKLRIWTLSTQCFVFLIEYIFYLLEISYDGAFLGGAYL